MKKSIKFKHLKLAGRIVTQAIARSGLIASAGNSVRFAGSVAVPGLFCAGLVVAGAAQADATQIDVGSNTAFPVISPLTIDDLGFTGAMNSDLFSDSRGNASSRTYRISSNSLLSGADTASPLTTSSMMEIESSSLPSAGFGSAGSPYADKGSGLVLDSRFAGLSSGAEGGDADNTVKVRRFSTAIRSSDGTVTVGNDWSNFQDFLGQPGGNGSLGSAIGAGRDPVLLGYGSAGNSRGAGVTARQLRWQPGGEFSNFSLAVENGLQSTLVDDSGESIGLNRNSSPNLVLSWHNDADDNSLYRVTALGSQLDLENSDQSGESVGWGLNLAGGWRFGDLVAALSVTLGNSIDSFILGRLGDANTAAAASKVDGADQSLSINPSLSYQLDNHANLHFSLNRFRTSAANAVHGVDTLDTIHLGYSWNPWPSTHFGIEFVGKDVEGSGEMDNSNAVNFAASKRF